MNFATSRFSRLLSFESDRAAETTSDDAPPVSDAPRWTSAMLAATCEVPSAARWTLREIPGWRRPAPRRRRRSRTRFPNVHPAADLGLVSEYEDLNPAAQTAQSRQGSALADYLGA
jgi:hypothetical protein